MVHIGKTRTKNFEEDFLFLITDTKGVDQRRFRVLDVDEKGNLYLYKAVLLCKNEIIKRLGNGTYSLAELTELGMIFLFYFLRHQYKLIKRREIDLNSLHALTFHVSCHLMPSFQDWEFQNVLVLRTFPE